MKTISNSTFLIIYHTLFNENLRTEAVKILPVTAT